MVLQYVQTWIPINQECFVPSLVAIGPVVLKKMILNFVNAFFLFRNYLPFGKGHGPLFEKKKKPTWIPVIQGCFGSSVVEIDSVVLEKKICFISSMYWGNFITIFPWNWVYPFILTNLNSTHQGSLVPSLVEISAVVFEKMPSNVFLLFCNYLLLEKGEVLYLTNVYRHHPRMLCACLALWFLRRF